MEEDGDKKSEEFSSKPINKIGKAEGSEEEKSFLLGKPEEKFEGSEEQESFLSGKSEVSEEKGSRMDKLQGLLIRLKKFCNLSPMGNLTLNELNALLTIDQGGLDKGKDLTMSEAGELLDLGRSAMSQLVSRLERKGMLKRALVLWDRRKTTVRLTPKGKKLVKQLEDDRIAKIENAISILGKDDFENFLSLLEKYMDAIEGDNNV